MPFVKHAMEGFQGDIRFFSTAMRWGELEQMAVFPDEIARQLDDEDDQLQRGLARSRLGPLVSYLTEVPGHFFSALTLILLPRDLNRAAVEATDPATEEWDFYFDRAPRSGPGRQVSGVLHLSGDVRLFPADGQHRLKAAVEALKAEPKLAREEVPVVMVPYRNRDQVRQLFADLNLNAKPVNKTVGYALDSRSPLGVLAKKTGAAIPLFRGRVNRLSNSLPRSSSNVITLNTLVECTRALVEPKLPAGDRVKLDQWVTANTNDAFAHVAAMWHGILEPFSDYWRGVLEGKPGAAGQLRDRFVFPYGLGWLALATFAAETYQLHGDEWKRRFEMTVRAVDWRRTNPEWEGRATMRGSVNNTGPAVKATVEVLRSRLS